MQDHQKRPNLDEVATINEDGSRYVVHPADVKGRYTTLRRITAWLLISIYVVLPWIPVNGYPAVFLDLDERRFHLFGLTLLSNDLWLLFFVITALAFTLFVLSSIVGRVWCGWYCPYTVFLEHVYRRVERWIEGDAVKRRKLDKAPWNKEKIIKRSVKWSAYVIISGLLAHVFLSYFISIPKVWEHVKMGPGAHSKEFLFILAFTGFFTFMFGWFREQFCIIMCPYGRFQSALTDDDTITVTYDHKRGEPRGKKRAADVLDKGDCIDCRKCVTACPTGIDIRNGIQLECIACSSCMDACNSIMDKIDRPRGLIRYDSINGIETGKKRVLRPRIYLYVFFTVLGCCMLILALLGKARPFHAEMSRLPGVNYTANEEGVKNVFTFKIINKRNQTMTYHIETTASEEISFTTVSDLSVPALGEKTFTIGVSATKEGYLGAKDISFDLISSDGSSITLKSRFTGPNQYLYQLEDNE